MSRAPTQTLWLRQALLRTSKEATEALSRVLRGGEEAAKQASIQADTSGSGAAAADGGRGGAPEGYGRLVATGRQPSAVINPSAAAPAVLEGGGPLSCAAGTPALGATRGSDAGGSGSNAVFQTRVQGGARSGVCLAGGVPQTGRQFLRAGLNNSCDFSAAGGVAAGRGAQRQQLENAGGGAATPVGSRLEEGEGWFVTDLLASGDGRFEKEVFSADEEERESSSSSIVLVPSIDSLSSLDREESVLQRPNQKRFLEIHDKDEDHDSKVPLLLAEKTQEQSEAVAQGEDPISSSSNSYLVGAVASPEVVEDLEASAASVEAGRSAAAARGRIYMINAGHGWTACSSLKGLLSFLRQTVRVFGTTGLHAASFVVPVADSEQFLEELQTMAPYTLKDFANVASTVAPPLALSVVARFLVVQVTEALMSWGLAAEGAAAAAAGGEAVAGAAAAAAAAGAAAAGEAAAAASSVATVCTSVAAAAPWVVLAGGLVYAVVLGTKELMDIRSRVVVVSAKEGQDGEVGGCYGLAPNQEAHCLIRWR
ncbi:hypothetical protein Emed_005911 [Eimeria media]